LDGEQKTILAKYVNSSAQEYFFCVIKQLPDRGAEPAPFSGSYKSKNNAVMDDTCFQYVVWRTSLINFNHCD
jgi:hypothetical protein